MCSARAYRPAGRSPWVGRSGSWPWRSPSRLVAAGAMALDGWSRAACAATLLATGLAALGIVHARGTRRLLAVVLLAGAGAGVALASAALELPLLWAGLALATTLGPL